jgi:aldose 1-epimerase
MEIHHQLVGSTAGHSAQAPTPVESYTLDTGAGLTVTVWTYGATLVEVLVPGRDRRTANVTVRLPDLANYEDRLRNPYIGAVLGRFCRCVAGGRFQLDGVEHRLDRNDGRHHLHGGSVGFDRFVWDAEAGRDGDALAVRLRLDRPDGDQGYPGALSAEVTYRASSDGRLRLDYQATATASTIVGLTSHAFWNLAGAGRVDGHRLRLNASRCVALDDELIPVPGAPASIAGTRLDYARQRPLGSDRLDNFFVVDNSAWAAELTEPTNGRAMRVVTDQPGLGVYTGEGLRPPRAGLSLQSSAFPDAPNRADFPSCRLEPSETYRHHIVHEFTVASKPARIA